MRMTRTMMLEVLQAGLYPHRLVQGTCRERVVVIRHTRSRMPSSRW